MCPEEGGATGLGELRSWWEVPAIAHFCSLFRTAFRLPDFEIEVSGGRCALSPRFSAGSRGPPTWRGVRAARGLGGGHEAGDRHGLPRVPARSRRRGSRLLLSARDPGALPGLLGRPEGESARALSAGAVGRGTGCGRTSGGRCGRAGAAPGRVGGVRETLARGALGRLAEARNSRLFESTSGGRGWGLGLGRSPCGTAWRSPSLGTPRL